jgi:hypothetical protein
MKAADIPSKFPIPFASAAGGSYVRGIPEDSQIGINDGWASLHDGFVPLNFQPIASGGVPPFGQDMNGILKQITPWSRWQNAGGLVPYDAAFSAAIGGYPDGAMLISATQPALLWLCVVDDNTTNPDAGGAGWVAFRMGGSIIQAPTFNKFTAPGAFSWTAPAGKYFARIWAWSGGGAGGFGASGAAGSGGCAGAFTQGIFSITPGQVITGVVGAGGANGTVTTGQANPGGNTTITIAGTTYTIIGGSGGNNAASGAALQPTNAAAAPSWGYIPQPGESGAGAFQGAFFYGGRGGNAFWGATGGQAGSGGANDANAPGAGGGGGAGGFNAGKGAPGAVWIET